MREIFTDKQFGAAASNMLGSISAILDNYSAQGYDLSLRQPPVRVRVERVVRLI